MLEKGEPVRIKLLDGSNHAGLVMDMDEDFIAVQCIYKFVKPQEADGVEEQVIEVLSKLSTKELLIISLDLNVQKKAALGLVIGQRKGLLSVMSTAMLEAMEDVLIPQQSPVNKVWPIVNVAEISSLVDEGQEKLFERWASNG